MYRAVDLFAGIGGIRLGFERAFGPDIETVFASEFDEPARKTYRANFKDSFDIAGDITKIDARDVPDFDICLAGFPCQAFSIAGKKLGFDDDYRGRTRGTLFFDTLRICVERAEKPKVIFCENVKGLRNHDKGRTLQVITDSLEDAGYKPFVQVLNSKDFGVPQNRERIYIVAFREDVAPESFVFPVGAGEKKVILDILDEAPISSKYYLSDTLLGTLRRHRLRHQQRGNGFGLVVRDLDGIAGSVVCGGMGRERNLIVDPREHSMVPCTNIKGEINTEDIRRMTPREWARLQGFPDSFELVVSDTQLYKQFGNSVTVPVVEAVARRVREVLEAVSS